MKIVSRFDVNKIVLENNLSDPSRANLSEADLREANLYGANLCGADLRGADLREADLRGADLREANLREANLYGANLCGADLRGADLREANLYRANLYGANLHRADLCGANLYEGKINKALSFIGLYDYWIFVVLFENGSRYIRMGCLNKSIEQWDAIGIRESNIAEYPDNKSFRSEQRVRAFEFAKATVLAL